MITDRGPAMRALLLSAALLTLCSGCGGGPAKVKGKLIEKGQPAKFPPNSAAVELTRVGGEATDAPATYTCVVNEDGSFEVVSAAGGQVAPGKYKVGVMLRGKFAGKYKELDPLKSTLTREIKPGANDLTIDLASPGG